MGLRPNASRPIRVRSIASGLAFAFAVLAFLGIPRISEPSDEGVAEALCNGLSGSVTALGMPPQSRVIYACTADGTITAWEPGGYRIRTNAFEDGRAILSAVSSA